MSIPVINLAAQHDEVRDELDDAIRRVTRAGGFIGGEEVSQFEREFADYLGARHVVSVANGTDALELALQAVGVGPGDAVLTTPFTFAGTLEAIVRVGARPVFADIKADDFTLDPDLVAPVCAAQPVKAMIVVHLYGYVAEMAQLSAIARAHGIVVIEDAAQAHGASDVIQGIRRRVGTLGDLACFSFYPTKNLGAFGDAGAVATDDSLLAQRLRLLANHGDAGKYEHVIPNGRNSRLDALQAAVLRVKLRRLDVWNDRRRRAAARYLTQLRDLPLLLPVERVDTQAVYHQFVIRVADRDALCTALATQGIGTAVHYPKALHHQPGFRGMVPEQATYPVAERCAAEVVSLPMSPHLDDGHIDAVTAALRTTLLERARGCLRAGRPAH